MVQFSDHFLDEVRARVPLVDLIGRRVKLRRQGREHGGLCPFHNEKTPSFTVSEDKGFFHCFGCGAHGSVFDFVMRTEGLSFPEAVERLAAEAGLEMPTASPEAAERERQAATLYDVLEAAAGWFENKLNSLAGQSALQYLRDRGLGDETMARFRLGFAPDSREELKQALQSRGFAEDLAVMAGLLKQPDDGGSSYDVFRNRIIFPIGDRRGRTIAFGGRALGEQRAKYLNSPETPLFSKGRVLYNLAGARQPARERGSVLVTEGYMDVIALCQAGLGHTVAPLGTALGEDQLGLLWRLAAEPVLCLDGDAAGRAAAQRAADRALPLLRPGYSLGFAFLPEGEDPDSLVRGQGAQAIERLAAEPVPLAEVLWQHLVAGRSLDTPERQAALRKDAYALVDRVEDATVRGYYGDFVAAKVEKLRPQRGGGRSRLGRKSKRQDRPRRGTAERPLPQRYDLGGDDAGSSERRERVLVATLVVHPGLFGRLDEDFVQLEIGHPELDKVRREILEIAGREPDLDSKSLRHHLSIRGLAAITDRLCAPDLCSVAPFLRQDAPLDEAEEGWRQTLALQHRAVGMAADALAQAAAFAADPGPASEGRLLATKRQEHSAAGLEAEPRHPALPGDAA